MIRPGNTLYRERHNTILGAADLLGVTRAARLLGVSRMGIRLAQRNTDSQAAYHEKKLNEELEWLRAEHRVLKKLITYYQTKL